MATYISGANGLWTANTTWRACATGTAAQVGSPAAASGWITVTNAYVSSPAMTFTTGEVIDGVVVLLQLWGDNLTGTLTLALFDGANELTTGTVNIADVSPNDKAADYDWIFVPFSGTVTADGGSDYTLKWKTDVANKVRILRFTATTNDVTRYFRTTANPVAAPTSGDNLIIVGSSLGSSYTVTMNETATTQYGWVAIGGSGILNYGGPSAGNNMAAGTNYVLRLGNYLQTGANGTFQMGTVANPCPRDSTAVLEFVLASQGQYGLRNCCGTFIAQGQSRTVGKNVVATLLTADIGTSATTASISADTGWLNGDEIVIAGTNNNNGQTETRTLNQNAGASSIQWTTGTTYAHTGTAPKQAEVFLLTRNVKIRSTNASYSGFGSFIGWNPVVDCDWVDVQNMGTTTGSLCAFDFDGTQGSSCTPNFNYCTHRDGRYPGFGAKNPFSGTLTVTNCTGYPLTGAYGYLFYYTSNSGTYVCNDNVISGGTSYNDNGIYITSLSTSASNSVCRNRISSCYTPFNLGSVNDFVPIFEDNVAHSYSPSVGLYYGRCHHGVIKNFTAWGSANSGFNAYDIHDVIFDSCNFFGHTNQCFDFVCGANVKFLNCTFRGDAIRGTAVGVLFYADTTYRHFIDVLFDNCSFGATVGHTTADLSIYSTYLVRYKDVEFRDCSFNSTNLLNSTFQQFMASGYSCLRFSKHSAAPIYRTLYRTGWIAIDTATYHTESPSEKLTPSAYCSTTNRHKSTIRRVKVANGVARNIKVWVYKDGSYAGSQPRLIQLANPALGIDVDTVLDTMTSGATTWEELSANCSTPNADGLLEFYVDCDGSAGAIYVDDWSVAAAV